MCTCARASTQMEVRCTDQCGDNKIYGEKHSLEPAKIEGDLFISWSQIRRDHIGLWIMEYLMVILPHWLPYCPVEAGIFESEFRIAWKLMWTYFPERDAHASLSSQTSRVVLKCDASRHEQVAYAHEHTLTSLSLKPAGSLLYAWHTVCGGRKSSIL